MTREIINSMVQHVLENSHKYEWSIQGFGMLRTYLPNDMRLNIWSREFRIPSVSLIHNHPWHFDSYVERGCLYNLRFKSSTDFPDHRYAAIKPGPRGGMIEQKGFVRLQPLPMEAYYPGDSYHQNASEIHLSDPIDGTVTINARTRIGPDEALVYWPSHMDWVSAEPRVATTKEIDAFVQEAVRALPQSLA